MGKGGVNLILELVTPDGLSTSAITTSEISSLDHEVLDDTVEGGSLIAKSFLKPRKKKKSKKKVMKANRKMGKKRGDRDRDRGRIPLQWQGSQSSPQSWGQSTRGGHKRKDFNSKRVDSKRGNLILECSPTMTRQSPRGRGMGSVPCRTCQ